MNDEHFTLDASILVYSVDRAAGDRHAIAKHIMRRASVRPCYLALQAISEFYAAVTRKQMMPSATAAQVARDMMDVFQTIPVSASAIRTALGSAAGGRTSYWDALLVATAAEAGCTTILTEDLADGSTLFGMRVLNPFAGGALAPAAAALLDAD
jgi:predicted nucleic acid-binding protein